MPSVRARQAQFLTPASAGVTVSVPLATLTLSPQTPTVSAPNNVSVSVPLATLTLSPQTPTVTVQDPTLMVEFDAANVVASDGTTVQTWADTSGNGRDATQATAGSRPTYRATGIGTQPAMDFASSKSMATSSITWTGTDTAFSAYAVFKRSAGTGNQSPWGISGLYPTFYGAAPGSTTHSLAPGFSVAPLAAVTVANATPTAAGQLQASAEDTTVVMAIVYDGAHFQISVNGNEAQQQYSSLAAVACTGNLGLTGALSLGRNAAAAQAFSGLLGYLQVYNVAHDRTTRKAKELTLRQRFGVTPKRRVAMVGDSITYGQASTNAPITGYPNQLATSSLLDASREWLIFNHGIGGSKANEWIATYLDQLVTPFALADAPTKGNIVVVMVGGNDNDVGVTDTDRWTRVSTICTTLRAAGWKVVLMTNTPRQSTLDFATYNALLRANWRSYADAVCDLTLDTAFDSLPTIASDTGNATYYADGTHLVDAGYLKVATDLAPVIDAYVTAVSASAGGRGRRGRFGFALLGRLGL